MKIIILTGKFGMGHLSAAKVLQKQIMSSLPGSDVILSDLYQIAFPRHCHLLYNSYARLMLHGGKIINAAYANAVHDDKGLPKSLSNPQNMLLKKLSSYLDQQQPDMIITTYSLASRLVSDYKIKRNNHCPHITCITDVGIHNVWINPDTALYLVSSRETKCSLLRRGVPAEKIAISGMPIADKFKAIGQGRDTSLSPRRRLLIMGGGLGMMPEGKGFYRRLSRIPWLQTTIICGQNTRLYRRLLSYQLPSLEIVGCCDNVAERMGQADLLLSKPGGITTFEAVYARLPLLMFPPSLEQEIKNCRFILRNGLGELLLGQKSTYPLQISRLIQDEAALQEMSAKMMQLRKGYDETALIDYINRFLVAERRVG